MHPVNRYPGPTSCPNPAAASTTTGIEHQPTEGADVPNLNEPREAEAMMVTLTRMEGKLDNVVDKVSDLRAASIRNRADIDKLQSGQQQLESDMKGAEETRLATALAVKTADEARVAAAKAQVDSSDRKWSPALRLAVIFGSLFTGLMVVVAFYVAMKPAIGRL